MTTVERMLPLYEGKMGHQFDHRFASFVGEGDADIEQNGARGVGDRVLPRFWVREEVAQDRLGRRQWGTDSALLGFRRVARNTDERTVVASLIPFGAVSYGWIVSAGPDACRLARLIAQYNSFLFDFVTRQFLSQPSIPQSTFEQLPTGLEFSDALEGVLGQADEWFVPRVAELTVTGEELESFGHELGERAVFVCDDARRALLRAELDAAFFHLYGVEREDVDYIMETFPIVKRKDIAAHGEYRTKRLILEIYDAMAEAAAHGTAYETILDPPPGQGPRHPAREAR